MRFRLWDINKKIYCKDYNDIADKVSCVTVAEGSKFATFAMQAPELLVEFASDCDDIHHEPVHTNDRIRYDEVEYIVAFEKGNFVAYRRSTGTNEPEYMLNELDGLCEIIGTIHDFDTDEESSDEKGELHD